jgi:hypothetical protein
MNAPIVQKGTNVPQIEIVPTVEIETRLGAETTEIKNGIVTALTAETDIPIIIKEEIVRPRTRSTTRNSLSFRPK